MTYVLVLHNISDYLKIQLQPNNLQIYEEINFARNNGNGPLHYLPIKNYINIS